MSTSCHWAPANDHMTGSVSERTWAVSARSCASSAPEATFAIETLPGISWMNGVAPLAISCRANSVLNGAVGHCAARWTA